MGDALPYILKIFSGEVIIAFSKVNHKKLKKSLIFSQFFCIYFDTFYEPLHTHSSFFTTFPHSYSLHHGVVVLFPFHLPSEWNIFFNFNQKMTKNCLSKLIFFSSRKCNPGVTTPTAEFKVLSRSFKKFLMRCSL